MMMDFAGRLKRLRIEKGYSQATLAKKSPMQAKSRFCKSKAGRDRA